VSLKAIAMAAAGVGALGDARTEPDSREGRLALEGTAQLKVTNPLRSTGCTGCWSNSSQAVRKAPVRRPGQKAACHGACARRGRSNATPTCRRTLRGDRPYRQEDQGRQQAAAPVCDSRRFRASEAVRHRPLGRCKTAWRHRDVSRSPPVTTSRHGTAPLRSTPPPAIRRASGSRDLAIAASAGGCTCWPWSSSVTTPKDAPTTDASSRRARRLFG